MNPDGYEECIIRAYVQLAWARSETPGFRTVTVTRFGVLEVRLTEIPEQQRLPDAPWLWLELYSHARHCVVDSCGCTELDETELARAVEFIASAGRQCQGLLLGGCGREEAQPRFWSFPP